MAGIGVHDSGTGVHDQRNTQNREESEAFLQTAREHAPQHYPLFFTALGTGLRPGELAGLQGRDIDWFNRSLTVCRSIDRIHRKVVPTKSKKVRHVKVYDEVLNVLKQHIARKKEYWLKRGVNEAPAWVFANSEGSWCDTHNLRERHYHLCLEKAGLRRRRLHDLRHSYASQLLAAGAPPAFIQKQLGHANVEITLRAYSHYLPNEADRRYLDQLPSLGARTIRAAQ